jgi:hypothetical protein
MEGHKMNRVTLSCVCFLISGMASAMGATLHSETFDGTNGAEITTLGWTKVCGATGDNLYINSDWAIDSVGGSYTTKGDMAKDDTWVIYSKSLSTAYTLAENDVVTATITYRSGRGVTNKFAILTDAGSYEITRLITNTDTGYNCYEPGNTLSLGYKSMYGYWWQTGVIAGASYFKIVATQNNVKFYYKDQYITSWTLLGTSSIGITTFNGIQIGGMVATDAANTYVQFDTLNVDVDTAMSKKLLTESFEGTEGSGLTSLGWVKNGGNSADKLYVDSSWSLTSVSGQAAKGDITRNGTWLTYGKTFTSYTLSEDDVVTATIAFRDGIYTSNKFYLLGSMTCKLTRSLGDQTSNGYTCADSVNGTLGTSSVAATWWKLYDKPAYYKIVATRDSVKYFYKDVVDTNWTFLGTSPTGMTSVRGVQIGGMATTGSYSYLQFDSLDITVSSRSILLKEDYSSGLSRWNESNFRGTASMTASTVTEGDNTFAQLTIQGSGSMLNSFYTSLPAMTGEPCLLQVDYRYKATEALPIEVSVTGGAGMNWPYIAYKKTTVVDGAWHNVTVNFDLTGFVASAPVLEFYINTSSAVAGDVLQIDDVLVTKSIPLMPSVEWRSPSSHQIIDQTDAQKVSLDLVNPTGVNCTFNIAVTLLASGSTVAQYTQTVTGDRQTFTIDTTSLAVGSYKVTVSAYGVELARWALSKLAYQQNSVLIRDGVPYVNGEPYLVIGLFHTSDREINMINEEDGTTTLTRDSLFQSLVDRKFNTVQYTWYVAPADFFVDAAEYNLMVLSESKNDYDGVEAVKNQPNVFGWYSYDEALPSRVGDCEVLYKKYKEIDPYHPVMNAFHQGGLGYGLEPIVDIAMPDRYPFYSSTTDFGEMVRFHVESNRDYLLKGDPTTSVIFVPQLFTIDAWNAYFPTYAQVRAEVYAAIHYGAKGFFYYGYESDETLTPGMPLNTSRKYWYLPECDLWNQIGTLNQELIDLKDIILFGETDSSVTFANTGSVLGRCVISSNGDRYVMLVNPTANSQSGILISGLSNVQLQPQFNSPTATLSSSKWTVSLPGYGVGVYYLPRILGDANSDGAVNVSDLSVLAAYYNTTSGATWAMGDFDGDKDVDIADLSILAANYNSGSTSTLSWADAYTQVFGTTGDAVNETSNKSTDDGEDSSSTICSSLGLSLIAGMVVMGMLIVKLDE